MVSSPHRSQGAYLPQHSITIVMSITIAISIATQQWPLPVPLALPLAFPVTGHRVNGITIFITTDHRVHGIKLPQVAEWHYHCHKSRVNGIKLPQVNGEWLSKLLWEASRTDYNTTPNARPISFLISLKASQKNQQKTGKHTRIASRSLSTRVALTTNVQ